MVLRLAGFSAFTSHRLAFGVGDIPVVDLLLGLLLGYAVALLDCPDQLIALACDYIEILIRQLAQRSLSEPLSCFHLP